MKNRLKIISLVVLLISCKTEKNVNCDAYSETLIIPYTDTIIMSSLHYHLEDEYICSWVPADTNIYNDTLYLEVYNENK
jgi:hypothetical protein